MVDLRDYRVSIIELSWRKYLPQYYYLFALCFLCIKFKSDGVEQKVLYIDANVPT